MPITVFAENLFHLPTESDIELPEPYKSLMASRACVVIRPSITLFRACRLFYADILTDSLRVDDFLHRHSERFVLYSLEDKLPIGLFEIQNKEDDGHEIIALAIYEPYQRQGFGRLFLMAIMQYYLAQGVREFELNTTEDGLQFYELLGFKRYNPDDESLDVIETGLYSWSVSDDDALNRFALQLEKQTQGTVSSNTESEASDMPSMAIYQAQVSKGILTTHILTSEQLVPRMIDIRSWVSTDLGNYQIILGNMRLFHHLRDCNFDSQQLNTILRIFTHPDLYQKSHYDRGCVFMLFRNGECVNTVLVRPQKQEVVFGRQVNSYVEKILLALAANSEPYHYGLNVFFPSQDFVPNSNEFEQLVQFAKSNHLPWNTLSRLAQVLFAGVNFALRNIRENSNLFPSQEKLQEVVQALTRLQKSLRIHFPATLPRSDYTYAERNTFNGLFWAHSKSPNGRSYLKRRLLWPSPAPESSSNKKHRACSF